MSRAAQYVVLVLIGTTVARVAATGESSRYVKDGMRVYLFAAGVCLLMLGLVSAWTATYGARRGHGVPVPEPGDVAGCADGHDEADSQNPVHDHARLSRAAWVLLVPVLCLLLVPPPALGAYSAQRAARVDLQQAAASDAFPALAQGSQPIAMTLVDYSVRALWDDQRTLDGQTVVLTGFVAADPAAGPAGSFLLTRMVLQCCAADASAVQVRILPTAEELGSQALAVDSWVQVVGHWVPELADSPELGPIGVLQADRVVPIAVPAQPYE